MRVVASPPVAELTGVAVDATRPDVRGLPTIGDPGARPWPRGSTEGTGMNVVIGGASGIGEAVARLLPGETLVADRVGGDVACDITDRASLDALVARVDQLDALVVTAGLSPSQASADAIMTVNLLGSALVLETFDPLIGEGTVVVLLASMAGHMGTFPPEVLTALDHPSSAPAAELTDDPATAYMMSKWGVMRLVRRTAAGYGRAGRASCPSRRGWSTRRWGRARPRPATAPPRSPLRAPSVARPGPRSWPRSSCSSAPRRPRSSPGWTGSSTAVRWPR